MRTHPTGPVSAPQLFPSATPAGTSRYAQLAAATEGDCYTKFSNNSISHWCGCNFFHPTCALPSPCTLPRRRANAGGSCYCTVPHVLHGLSRQDGWLSSYFYFPITFSSILYITYISIYNGGTHTHYRIHHIYMQSKKAWTPLRIPTFFQVDGGLPTQLQQSPKSSFSGSIPVCPQRGAQRRGEETADQACRTRDSPSHTGGACATNAEAQWRLKTWPANTCISSSTLHALLTGCTRTHTTLSHYPLLF